MSRTAQRASRAALCCFLAASSIVGRAQVPLDPGAVQGHSRDILEHRDVDKKINSTRDAKPSLETPTSTQSGQAASGPAFLLRQIITDESAILTASEIRFVTSRYEQKQVTIADINEAVNALNKVYERKGYTTARAVLPPQQVRDGVVRIRFVEGRVGKIVIAKNTRTRDSYFLSRIHLNAGDLIQVSALQRDLAYFNATNDLKLHALLEPGSAFATADIVLEAAGPEDAEVTTFFDDAGRKTIGRQRAGAVVRFNTLFGNRDPLAVGMLGADGTLGAFINYGVPLGTRGLRLAGSYDYDTIEINAGPLGSAGLVGHSFDASARLSRPLFVGSGSFLTTSIAAHWKQSVLEAEGFPLTQTRVRSLEEVTEFQRFDTRGLWFATSAINAGFHNLGGSQTFFRFNGSVARVLTITRDVTATLRASGQVNALDPLPPIEQWQIGGIASVRGYPEGRLIGDKGYLVSGELAFPLRASGTNLLGPWLTKRVKAAAFVDHGGVIDEGFSGSALAHDTILTSVGIGVTVHVSSHIAGRIDFGFPLRNRAGIESVGIHYYIQTSYPFSRWWRRAGSGDKAVDR